MRPLRDALGSFATGVTIVTTTDAAGAPVGLTVNSFSSVSLDPPLILWSLARTADSLPAFARGGPFVVHVLAADQQALAVRFASKAPGSRFRDVPWRPCDGGAPLIDGCAAWFRCDPAARHEAGDHIVFIGQVAEYAHTDAPPLLFHRGRYADLRPRGPVGADAGLAEDEPVGT